MVIIERHGNAGTHEIEARFTLKGRWVDFLAAKMCRECCGTCSFVVKYVVDCRDTQRSLFWNSPGLCLDNNKQLRGHRPPTGRHPQSALPRLWLNKDERFRNRAIGSSVSTSHMKDEAPMYPTSVRTWCVTEYNSDPYINNVLSCPPAEGVAEVANLSFSAEATWDRSFGFNKCHTSKCQRGIRESHVSLHNTSAAFGSDGSGDRIVYTVCAGSADNSGCAQIRNKLSGGGYTCSCRPGFVLMEDGHGCEEDECATDNGGCAQTCTKVPGSYTCSCQQGFVLMADAHGCKADECATENGRCDQICTKIPRGYRCFCRQGFVLMEDAHGCRVCGHCLGGDVNCDPVSGVCSAGCRDGWKTQLCNKGTFCGRVQDAVRDFPRESAGRPPGECDTFCGSQTFCSSLLEQRKLEVNDLRPACKQKSYANIARRLPGERRGLACPTVFEDWTGSGSVDPPVDLAVTDITDEGFKVTWSPSPDPDLQGYRVVVSNMDMTTAVNQSTDEAWFPVVGLFPETTYIIRVTALFSSGGWRSQSEAAMIPATTAATIPATTIPAATTQQTSRMTTRLSTKPVTSTVQQAPEAGWGEESSDDATTPSAAETTKQTSGVPTSMSTRPSTPTAQLGSDTDGTTETIIRPPGGNRATSADQALGNSLESIYAESVSSSTQDVLQILAQFHGLSRPYTRIIIGSYLAISRRYHNTLTLLQHFNSSTASPGLTQESLSVAISPFPGATATH
ncbi:carbohydrate binding [Branchiostoma belcheri]|nr:carbohydrate binding [Branchiostoma belcheri]